jgi:nucleoside-diphosphate-sugar epimerase
MTTLSRPARPIRRGVRDARLCQRRHRRLAAECPARTRFLRSAEVDLLIGDSTKAREQLGWKPEVTFEQLVDMMVRHDLERETAAPGRRQAPRA